MIRVKVELTSYFRKELGQGKIELSLQENANIMDLAREMGKIYGESVGNMLIDKERGYFKVLSFVNSQICQKDQSLKDNDIVKLLPLIAGG